MKISIAGRKIILVVAILVIFFLIITQRKAASDQIADLQVRYEACKRHAESLATQLEVVNSHKKKIESMLADIKSEQDFTIKECELKLRTIREEDRMNKQKLLSCEQRVSLGNNPTGVLLSNITEIQLQNQRYVEEIARLKSQLLGNQGELKSQESRSSTPTTSVQHAENHQNLVLP
uniref:Uncharacterized protein n=1 Tax=Acrobeloides nanus TaxID=290746 RepID=A0A914DAP8_9BILA